MQFFDAETIEAVRALLGVQLKAVQQHFIHVLILQTRGNHAFAERITAIDNTDLSVAMRWIERLVAQDVDPLNDNAVSGLGASMPNPGFSDEGIRRSEIALENDLADALKEALDRVSGNAGEDVRDLLARTLRPRADYTAWLRRKPEMQATPHASVSKPPTVGALADDVSLSLHGLFANLMTVITQELVHAFVHRQSGNRARADAAWEISGAAMMQATKITRLLAGHRIAPAPQLAVAAACPVQAPRIELTSDGALHMDRSLALHCAEEAEICAERLDGTEFEPVVRGCRDYFLSAAAWRDGISLPDIPNPCRDFERTLGLYVRPAAGRNSA